MICFALIAIIIYFEINYLNILNICLQQRK